MTELMIVGDFSPIPPDPEPPNLESRWCGDCGGTRTFIESYRYDGGRVGICLGCEQVKRIPYDRTNSEAA